MRRSGKLGGGVGGAPTHKPVHGPSHAARPPHPPPSLLACSRKNCASSTGGALVTGQTDSGPAPAPCRPPCPSRHPRALRWVQVDPWAGDVRCTCACPLVAERDVPAAALSSIIIINPKPLPTQAVRTGGVMERKRLFATPHTDNMVCVYVFVCVGGVPGCGLAGCAGDAASRAPGVNEG